MNITHITIPSKYFNHKKKRIRKKWIKRYGKISEYTDCHLISIGSVNKNGRIYQDEIPFIAKLTVTPEMEELSKIMIDKRKKYSLSVKLSNDTK